PAPQPRPAPEPQPGPQPQPAQQPPEPQAAPQPQPEAAPVVSSTAAVASPELAAPPTAPVTPVTADARAVRHETARRPAARSTASRRVTSPQPPESDARAFLTQPTEPTEPTLPADGTEVVQQDDAVLVVAFSPDGRLLASAGLDGT